MPIKDTTEDRWASGNESYQKSTVPVVVTTPRVVFRWSRDAIKFFVKCLNSGSNWSVREGHSKLGSECQMPDYLRPMVIIMTGLSPGKCWCMSPKQQMTSVTHHRSQDWWLGPGSLPTPCADHTVGTFSLQCCSVLLATTRFSSLPVCVALPLPPRRHPTMTHRIWPTLDENCLEKKAW
jgi:hypothetical protein